MYMHVKRGIITDSERDSVTIAVGGGVDSKLKVAQEDKGDIYLELRSSSASNSRNRPVGHLFQSPSLASWVASFQSLIHLLHGTFRQDTISSFIPD
jgi:hypothetical protein